MLVEAGGDTGIQQIDKVCEKKKTERKLNQNDQRKEKSFRHVGVEPGLLIR